jgi:hypothetical protein
MAIKDHYEIPRVSVSGCSRGTYSAQLEHLASKCQEHRIALETAAAAGEMRMPAVVDCK